MKQNETKIIDVRAKYAEKPNKTNLWLVVEDILAKYNITDNAKEDLAAFLKPKVGGSKGSNEHLPKLDKDGNIVELYCSWFEVYKPIKEFKKSAKSKSGYHYNSVEADKQWKLYLAKEKDLNSQLTNIGNDIMDGKITNKEGVKLRDKLRKELSAVLDNKAKRVYIDEK